MYYLLTLQSDRSVYIFIDKLIKFVYIAHAANEINGTFFTVARVNL